jgi:hypothetical protein
MRPLTTVLALAGTAAAVSGAALLPGSAAAASPTPAKTVTATTVTVRTGTLAVGTIVPASKVEPHRTFLGASFGVGLASTDQAQYPVQTGNGGRTWRTTGPALHVDAANAPDAVTTVDAATKKLQYAYGSGQVVDVTSGGGPTWRSALFDGVVMAVVPGIGSGQLVAFIDAGSGTTGSTWQYVSRDGGRTWHYATRIGG